MSLSVVIIIIISAALAIIFWLFWFWRGEVKKNQLGARENEKWLNILERLAVISQQNKMLADQNSELRQVIDKKLSEAHEVSREQINHTIKTLQGITGQSAKQIADVVKGLTRLEETNKQVINFSAQLQNLQDILKNPKQRGVLGEYFLEETLKNVLPPNSYQMQYKFKDGLVADAVVFVKEKIIPIDSKFTLENYEKILGTRNSTEKEKLEKMFKIDVKNRIDETAKYIKPEEKTMDFAFMFIPSEAIYYDLLINKIGAIKTETRDLIEYAFREKKVIIVSPTSFLAYLQTVLQGLRALQIEEGAKQIRSNVEKLGRHILTFEEFMKKVHGSLGTTVSHFNSAYKELGKIDKDVIKITGGEKNINPLVLDKPREE